VLSSAGSPVVVFQANPTKFWTKTGCVNGFPMGTPLADGPTTPWNTTALLKCILVRKTKPGLMADGVDSLDCCVKEGGVISQLEARRFFLKDEFRFRLWSRPSWNRPFRIKRIRRLCSCRGRADELFSNEGCFGNAVVFKPSQGLNELCKAETIYHKGNRRPCGRAADCPRAFAPGN